MSRLISRRGGGGGRECGILCARGCMESTIGCQVEKNDDIGCTIYMHNIALVVNLYRL